MQFKLCLKAILGLLLLSCLHIECHAQSNWKFGVGLGINYSELKEQVSSTNSLFLSEDDKSQIGFSTFIRVENYFTNKWKVSASPAITFIGSNLQDNTDSKLESVLVSLPLQIHYELFHNFYLGSGPTIDYLLNLTNEANGIRTNITSQSNNRFLFGLRHSISYVIKDWVEIGLSYNHIESELDNLNVTDIDGNLAGEYSAKFKYFQFSVAVRH